MIPVTGLERLARPIIVEQVVQPPAPPLFVDPTCPHAWSLNTSVLANILIRINLDLVSVHLPIAVFRHAVTADLHTRVQRLVHLEFILENEVGIIFLRAQKTVRSVGHGLANNGSVYHRVASFSSALNPPVQTLPIEKGICPVLGVQDWGSENERKGAIELHQSSLHPGEAAKQAIQSASLDIIPPCPKLVRLYISAS